MELLVRICDSRSGYKTYPEKRSFTAERTTHIALTSHNKEEERGSALPKFEFPQMNADTVSSTHTLGTSLPSGRTLRRAPMAAFMYTTAALCARSHLRRAEASAPCGGSARSPSIMSVESHVQSPRRSPTRRRRCSGQGPALRAPNAPPGAPNGPHPMRTGPRSMAIARPPPPRPRTDSCRTDPEQRRAWRSLASSSHAPLDLRRPGRCGRCANLAERQARSLHSSSPRAASHAASLRRA